jgi:hypothetical protein
MFGCFAVDDRRAVPSSRGLVCSDGEAPSSSTSAIEVVVAAQEYCPAAFASMFLLRRRVTRNLIMPIIAYMPKTGGYVSFQSIPRYVR